MLDLSVYIFFFAICVFLQLALFYFVRLFSDPEKEFYYKNEILDLFKNVLKEANLISRKAGRNSHFFLAGTIFSFLFAIFFHTLGGWIHDHFYSSGVMNYLFLIPYFSVGMIFVLPKVQEEIHELPSAIRIMVQMPLCLALGFGIGGISLVWFAWGMYHEILFLYTAGVTLLQEWAILRFYKEFFHEEEDDLDFLDEENSSQELQESSFSEGGLGDLSDN